MLGLSDGTPVVRQTSVGLNAESKLGGPIWSLTALALICCKPNTNVATVADESPARSAVSDSHESRTESTNRRSPPKISADAIPVRHVVTELEFEVAAVSEGRLLLATPDGSAEIRDSAGITTSTLKIELLPLIEAAPVPGGWVVIGSLPARHDAQEKGAAIRVTLDGKVGPTWHAPGLFGSLATGAGTVLASDLLGPVYSLLRDGSLIRVQVPPKVQGSSVRVVFWKDKSVFCKKGELRKEGDPYGICVASDGMSIRDIWRVPPIACGTFLVADVREDARTTSEWSRMIWPDLGMAGPLKHPLTDKPVGIGCIDDFLVDLKAPGKLEKLPSLEELREPLCDPESVAVVPGEDDVWCIGRGSMPRTPTDTASPPN